MTDNFLSNLKIDYWYKILPVIGCFLIIISLTVDVKVFDNITVFLLGLGVICVGIGEWINHPLQTAVGHNCIITSYNRLNKLSGNVWDFIGFFVMVVSLYFYCKNHGLVDWL